MHILEDELLDEDFIAAVTRRSKSAIADWRRKGTGPAFIHNWSHPSLPSRRLRPVVASQPRGPDRQGIGQKKARQGANLSGRSL